MINLIKKDFNIVSKLKIVTIIYALIISIIGCMNPRYPGVIYVLGMILMVYIRIAYADGYDDINKSQCLMHSLPIDRKDVVRAKYTSLILYIFIVFCEISLWTFFIKILGLEVKVRSIKIKDFIITFNFICIFYGIYYPIYFKIGYEKLKKYMKIISVLIFFLPYATTEFILQYKNGVFIKKIISSDFIHMMYISFLVVIIIFIVSEKISEKVYDFRDF